MVKCCVGYGRRQACWPAWIYEWINPHSGVVMNNLASLIMAVCISRGRWCWVVVINFWQYLSIISMVKCNITVTPMLTHSNCCNLALSHRYCSVRRCNLGCRCRFGEEELEIISIFSLAGTIIRWCTQSYLISYICFQINKLTGPLGIGIALDWK